MFVVILCVYIQYKHIEHTIVYTPSGIWRPWSNCRRTLKNMTNCSHLPVRETISCLFHLPVRERPYLCFTTYFLPNIYHYPVSDDVLLQVMDSSRDHCWTELYAETNNAFSTAMICILIPLSTAMICILMPLSTHNTHATYITLTYILLILSWIHKNKFFLFRRVLWHVWCILTTKTGVHTQWPRQQNMQINVMS